MLSLICDFDLAFHDHPTYPDAGEQITIDPVFDAFLKSLDEARQSRSKPGAEPWATRLEGVSLPQIGLGYPDTFLISLFRFHVPRMKTLTIPRASCTLRVQEIQVSDCSWVQRTGVHVL
jgi:hypothetical protein